FRSGRRRTARRARSHALSLRQSRAAENIALLHDLLRHLLAIPDLEVDEAKPVDLGRLHPQERISRVERVHGIARAHERPAVLRKHVVPERRAQVDPLARERAHHPLAVKAIPLERAAVREAARADRQEDERLEEEDPAGAPLAHRVPCQGAGQRSDETSFFTARSAASSAAWASASVSAALTSAVLLRPVTSIVFAAAPGVVTIETLTEQSASYETTMSSTRTGVPVPGFVWRS